MVLAIQGGDASFHDIAGRHYFSGKVQETIKCPTFREVFTSLESGKADYGIIVIENSIAGTILSNYSLLQEFQYPIIGELRLRIILCLMALPGTQIADLTTVRSHYMALLQCNDFLEQYPHIKIEENHDTADSAKEIKEQLIKNAGAIAGKYAAELYGLDVLAESIETNKQNYTRFLILAGPKSKERAIEPNKASLSLILDDKIGSLSKVLRQFDEFGINLTKIQSIPLLGYPEKYTFYLDCDWTVYNDFKNSIDKITTMVESLTILGEYKKGEVV